MAKLLFEIHDPVAILLCILLGILLILIFFLIKKNRFILKKIENELHNRTIELEAKTSMAKAASKAKSDFLSRMSHEIRTPLNAIMGMNQIALNSISIEKIKECLKKSEDNSKHLLGIINDILDFSKMEAGKLLLEESCFNLCESIDFVCSMFKSQILAKRINLIVQSDNIKYKYIYTDPLRLNQVLINLLSNAIKFTELEGTVSLTASELLHVDQEGVYKFTVSDTGIGIAPDQAKKLFTPFEQANYDVKHKYGGTGLGLAISKSIVTLMGGDIDLDTELGKGSIFSFTIRVKSQNFPEAGIPKIIEQEKPVAALTGKHLLVVDDIEINREIIISNLEDTGVHIDTAADGREAFEKFISSPLDYYNLILMDMQMPVMDGCETTIKIRGSGRTDALSVKIIAMTANVMEEDVKRVHEAGMDSHMGKPLDINELYSILKEL